MQKGLPGGQKTMGGVQKVKLSFSKHDCRTRMVVKYIQLFFYIYTFDPSETLMEGTVKMSDGD